MKKHQILFITTLLFGIFMQGCGTENTTQVSTPKAIGESVSIVTDKPNTQMTVSRHALESVSNQIANILKLHINELNEREAISFDKETLYCDISGVKNAEHRGNLQKIIMNNHYKTCKSINSIQNGEIQITYNELDENGQFPKSLEMISSNDYQFNHLTLNKNTLIETKEISYTKNGSIQTLSLKINGTVYNYTQKLEFDNYSHQVLF